MDYINIGSTPPEEDCLGVNHPLARQETEVYRNQLQREFPEARLTVKGFPHEFGRYYEVVAWFGEELTEEQNAAAWEAECGIGFWDEEALAELKRLGIRSAA